MVSVVVPVYNTEKYLRRCMDALVMQTIADREIEIIAVDDGSTDSSPGILQEYAGRYPGKVRVFSKSNGGQASARNLGIKMAKGDYIGFADSDDYVDRTLFEKMYNLAKKEDADFVECGYHSMFEKSSDNGDISEAKEIAPRGTIKEREDNKELFIDPQVSPWNKLYRRKILTDNDVYFPEGVIYEDTSFYIKTLPFIKKTAFLDEKLVYYSVRKGSTMTANYGSRVLDILKVLDDAVDFYVRKGILTEYFKELEYFCVKIAFCSNFSRIARVDNGYMRREFFNKTFDFVNRKFPNYKKNKYLKGMTGLYIKTVNRRNCVVYARVLSRALVG